MPGPGSRQWALTWMDAGGICAVATPDTGVGGGAFGRSDRLRSLHQWVHIVSSLQGKLGGCCSADSMCNRDQLQEEGHTVIWGLHGILPVDSSQKQAADLSLWDSRLGAGVMGMPAARSLTVRGGVSGGGPRPPLTSTSDAVAGPAAPSGLTSGSTSCSGFSSEPTAGMTGQCW